MPAKKNAPFEMPKELQAEFDATAETLVIPKAQLLRMAVAKGLPIVRAFLLSERQKLPVGLPKPFGDVSLNAATPIDDAPSAVLPSGSPANDEEGA